MKPQEILFKEAYVILQNAKNITTELDDVINLVTESSLNNKHVIITGVGKNSDIASKIAATYSSVGIPSFYLDSYKALHGDLGMVLKDQLLIGISKSGNTEELNLTFESAGSFGAKLVSITCNKDSGLGKIAKKFNGLDIVLNCEFEADANNVAPTCSSTLFLAVGDAIGCCASFKLNFDKKQFLIRHPAGSLGKQLSKDLSQEK